MWSIMGAAYAWRKIASAWLDRGDAARVVPVASSRLDPGVELGKELEVKHPTSGPVGTYVVRGLRARGGQGAVYILTGPSGRPAVLKVPGAKGLLASEVERRILQNLVQHK